jgi:hypothetical protein
MRIFLRGAIGIGQRNVEVAALDLVEHTVIGRLWIAIKLAPA